MSHPFLPAAGQLVEGLRGGQAQGGVALDAFHHMPSGERNYQQQEP